MEDGVYGRLNDRSFEDRERTFEEMSLFLQIFASLGSCL